MRIDKVNGRIQEVGLECALWNSFCKETYVMSEIFHNKMLEKMPSVLQGLGYVQDFGGRRLSRLSQLLVASNVCVLSGPLSWQSWWWDLESWFALLALCWAVTSLWTSRDLLFISLMHQAGIT